MDTAQQNHGWTGRTLRVDLATGESAVLRLEPELCRSFLGGRGLCGHFLRQAMLANPGADLPLVVAAGPLAGSDVPGACRCHLSGPSPLTGGVADGGVGGMLGQNLKGAGFDALILTGRAKGLLGLDIDATGVRMADASQLAGRSTDEAQRSLRATRPSGSVLLTGPAADAGCRFASLVADGRELCGRGGLGRAAALKGLKYICVAGHAPQPVADPEGLAKAREDILRLACASPALMGRHGFTNFGTASLIDLMEARGMLPADNFRATRFAAADKLNAHALAAKEHPVRRSCPGCPVACHGMGAAQRQLPEYEALAGFTALIGSTSLELALRAADLCLRLGLDPASAASALACHRELGGGRDYAPQEVLDLLAGMAGQARDVAAAELGAALGQGAARYASAAGRPELAMAVKGLELPPFDPRGGYGMALGFAVSTRGGCHERAWALSHEVLRKPVATDRFSFIGKARMLKNAEDMFAAAESLGVCPRLLLSAGLEEYARALAAVTGSPCTGADLLRVGARVDCQERLMNAAFGFSAEDDDLPGRFFAEAGSGTPEVPVPPLPREDFLAARAAYYRVRGLSEQGLPMRETAESLGLAWPAGGTAQEGGL